MFERSNTGALAHARARAREKRETEKKREGEDPPGPTAARLKDLATRFRAPVATVPCLPPSLSFTDHVSIPRDTDGLVCYVIDPQDVLKKFGRKFTRSPLE